MCALLDVHEDDRPLRTGERMPIDIRGVDLAAHDPSPRRRMCTQITMGHMLYITRGQHDHTTYDMLYMRWHDTTQATALQRMR